MPKAKLTNQFFNVASGKYLQPGTEVEVVKDMGQYVVCYCEMCYHIIQKTSLKFENEKQTNIFDFIGEGKNA